MPTRRTMDEARWDRVEAIFSAALEREGDARASFIREACGDDTDLREAVVDLLSHHGEEPDFLERPVARVTELAGEIGAEEGPTRRIGPYRLVRPLGRGGMGEVYLAIQEGEGFTRPVALKLIRPGLDGSQVLRRFELERRILAGLKHPNVASLLDGGVTDDGRPYLVMEFVEGVRIDGYCDERSLSLDERIRLFRSVCAAVQHAHQNLILHRDIKPANILVTGDGIPKLLDFGVAKLVDPVGGDVEVTRTEARMLTPEYASPEQITGDHVSVATDVFCLGVLLYELLTGRRPHEPRTDEWRAAEKAVVEDEAARPSSVVTRGTDDELREAARKRGLEPRRLRRRLSGDLDTIILRALSKEPQRRYASVAALSDDLARHQSGLPIHARPATPGYRAGKFIRRHPWPLGAAAVVFLALAASVLVSTRQSRRIAVERDRALEVESFLLEMFGATGPNQSTGDTVTARELLDRQAATLTSLYQDQPELRAEMMVVLAEGYDRLGLLAEADTLASAALEVRRTALGGDHGDVGAALGLLGWIRHEEGESREGEELLRQAIDILDGSGTEPRALARAFNDLGVVREAAGDYDEASADYERALYLERRTVGPRHRSFAVTASNLSVILYRKGDLDSAVATAREALTAMRASLGPDHQRSIVIQSNLAAMQAAQGNDEGALDLYRDLLARQERIRGPDHPVTVSVMTSLSGVLNSVGRWRESEALVRRALAAQEERLGPDHPRNGILLVRLSQALTGQRRFDEGVATAQRALTLYEPALDVDHPLVAEAMETLANALEPTDPARAETLHRDAVGRLESRLGPDSPQAALARMRLAERLRSRGRWSDALPLYRKSYASLRSTLAPGHRSLHQARVRIAEMLLATGARHQADSVLSEAEAAFALGGAEPSVVALADSLRAELGPGPGGS